MLQRQGLSIFSRYYLVVNCQVAAWAVKGGPVVQTVPRLSVPLTDETARLQNRLLKRTSQNLANKQ